MGCRGARGDKGNATLLGVMGMPFIGTFGALGAGEFMGLSSGRGLSGRPGLATGGAARVRLTSGPHSDS